jgi:hypothetical protein
MQSGREENSSTSTHGHFLPELMRASYVVIRALFAGGIVLIRSRTSYKLCAVQQPDTSTHKHLAARHESYEQPSNSQTCTYQLQTSLMSIALSLHEICLTMSPSLDCGSLARLQKAIGQGALFLLQPLTNRAFQVMA